MSEGQASPGSQAPAPPSRGERATRLAAVALLVALDLWSKRAVFAWLEPGPPGLVRDACLPGHLRWPLAGDWLAFMLSWNPGMAWGLDFIPSGLLVGGRSAAVLFLAWLLVRAPRGRPAFVASLVLILAGALGNLYDNLFLAPRRLGARFGEVRDFIDVYFSAWDWHFPTFNVADSCISVGAVLLLYSSLRPARGGVARAS